VDFIDPARVNAARSMPIYFANYITQLLARKPFKVVAVALANKTLPAVNLRIAKGSSALDVGCLGQNGIRGTRNMECRRRINPA